MAPFNWSGEDDASKFCIRRLISASDTLPPTDLRSSLIATSLTVLNFRTDAPPTVVETAFTSLLTGVYLVLCSSSPASFNVSKCPMSVLRERMFSADFPLVKSFRSFCRVGYCEALNVGSYSEAARNATGHTESLPRMADPDGSGIL